MNCRIALKHFGLILPLVALAACSTSKVKTLSDKERVPLLLELAAADLSEGDPTGALTALIQAREIDDKSPEEHYLFALAYYQKREPKLALESAKRAIRLNPKYSRAKNTLGKLLLDQGKYDEAQTYLLEAANDLTFRESFVAKTNLGDLYYKTSNYPKAKKWLKEAISDNENESCMAHYFLGQINLEENQLADAQSNFTRATKKGCSQFTDAYLAVGKTLVRMKKYDLARAKFIELKQLFPNSEASNKASEYLREIP